MTIRKSIRLLIILSLFILLIFLGWEKLPVLLYNQGCNYYERKLYDEAIAHFRKALEISPSSAIVHYSLANAYMEKGMPDKAIEEYKKTIQADHDYIQAYHALSRIYSSHEMYEEAISQLKQAEAILPADQYTKKLLEKVYYDYTFYLLDKSTELFLSGDKTGAHNLLNKALEIKPDFTFTHYTLAYLYFTEHNYDEALRRLNRLINIDSQYGPAYKLLGDIYFEKGIYKIAISNYKKALTLNSSDPTINNDLGLALMQMERYDEALIYLKEALRLQPDNLRIRYSLASVYRDRGMFTEAVSEYKKVVSYQSDYPNINNDLGDIYRVQGENKNSIEEYKKEIKYCNSRLLINQNDPETLNNLAYAFSGIGDYSHAKEIIDKVLAVRPNYRQAHLTLAKIYERAGNINKAMEELGVAKTLSTQTNFMDRDMGRLRSELNSPLKTSFINKYCTVYLKNGRQINGKVQEEDGEKIVLQVNFIDRTENLILYRNMIEQIVKSDDGKNN